MPGVPPIPGQELPHTIADIIMRLRAIETQQQSVISNLQGQPVVATGVQPGSDPAEYGIGLLNQAFGSTLAFFGEDAAGNVGMYFYDGSGNKLSEYDGTALRFYDGSGNERVIIGLLPSGDYGLAVLDASGNTAEILPQYSTFGAGPYTVSTSGTAALGLSMSAPVGQSGDCYANLEALLVSTATNGVNAELILYRDGSPTALNVQTYENNATYGPAQLTLSGRVLLTGLTPGPHTFAVYGTSTYGCNAENVSIGIQPV